MKKIISILVLLAASCTILMAQSMYPMSLQKGSISAGGGSSFSFGNLKNSSSSPFGSGSSEYSYSNITFEPRVSYFISNGLAAGLITDFTRIGIKSDDGDKSSDTQFSVGPMIRYYLPGGFFIHGDYTFGKNTYTSGDYKDQSDLTKYTFGVGYAAFISPKIAIEPSVMYRNTSMKEEEDEYKSKSSLGEFVLGVSINFYLNWREN